LEFPVLFIFLEVMIDFIDILMTWEYSNSLKLSDNRFEKIRNKRLHLSKISYLNLVQE